MEITVGPDIRLPDIPHLARYPVRINGDIVGHLYQQSCQLELEVKVAEALLAIVKQIACDFDPAIASAAFADVRFVLDGSVAK